MYAIRSYYGQPEKFEWEGSGKDPELLNCGDFVIDGEWSEWDKWREFYDEEGNRNNFV